MLIIYPQVRNLNISIAYNDDYVTKYCCNTRLVNLLILQQRENVLNFN